jgi:hypothetical protein
MDWIVLVINMEPSSSFFVEEPPPVSITPTEKKSKTVSFSQYAKWMKCPMSWKLAYIDYLAPYEASINTIFGDGVHEALQEYLRLLYGPGGASAADGLDYMALFNKTFDEGITKDLKTATEEQAKLTEEEREVLGVITKEEIEDFRKDAQAILEHVVSPSIRMKHFPSRKFEVVGIELPLEIPMRGGNITFKGYLDIVLRDKITKKIVILDFKTSTYGWNKYQKMDRTKIDQLLLYKLFYHQLYKIPMSDIEVEFFIVKRKLYEDVGFPQQRIQRVPPADGKLSMREVQSAFVDFINECFTPEGLPNKDGKYLKNPGKARKNCKYCTFKTLTDKDGKLYCDGVEG